MHSLHRIVWLLLLLDIEGSSLYPASLYTTAPRGRIGPSHFKALWTTNQPEKTAMMTSCTPVSRSIICSAHRRHDSELLVEGSLLRSEESYRIKHDLL